MLRSTFSLSVCSVERFWWGERAMSIRSRRWFGFDGRVSTRNFIRNREIDDIDEMLYNHCWQARGSIFTDSIFPYEW